MLQTLQVPAKSLLSVTQFKFSRQKILYLNRRNKCFFKRGIANVRNCVKLTTTTAQIEHMVFVTVLNNAKLK